MMMERALREAAKGLGRTRPNPSVGCVIACGDRVIASGHTAPAGGPHAEVAALKAAGEDARGADVYVTLEPCNHFGRTPPCTEALVRAGIARIFVGMRDPHPLVDGRGIQRLRSEGVEVEVGLLEEACRRTHEAFLHHVRTRRPFVVAKLAQSLDGRVATRTGESKWITNAAARRRGHELRDRLDAIAVGVGTVLADDPELSCRIRGGRDPIRVIVDTHARTPPDAKVVRYRSESEAPTWIAVGDAADRTRIRELEDAGATVIQCGIRDGKIWLDDLLVRLGERDITSLLLEGGPTLIGSFRDHALLDKMHIFVAPILIGGRESRSSLEGEGPAELAQALRLDIADHEWLDGDLVLTGYPVATR